VSLAGYFTRFALIDENSASYAELKGYWSAYGGIAAIKKSPAVRISFILTVLCSPYWVTRPWQESTVSIVPNLLGFTLGAMAVVLAFPSTRMFEVIAEKGAADSYYIDMASKFVHFIFVQVIAILIVLVGKAYNFSFIGAIGFFFLCYAVLCAAMTGLALYGVAQIFNHPGSVALLEKENSK
jgi:hypothetical protein